MSFNQDEIDIKIILLGNSGVGKTCIINRYVNIEFDPNIDQTLGNNTFSKLIKKIINHID